MIHNPELIKTILPAVLLFITVLLVTILLQTASKQLFISFLIPGIRGERLYTQVLLRMAVIVSITPRWHRFSAQEEFFVGLILHRTPRFAKPGNS